MNHSCLLLHGNTLPGEISPGRLNHIHIGFNKILTSSLSFSFKYLLSCEFERAVSFKISRQIDDSTACSHFVS
jgi:hypothetical protein